MFFRKTKLETNEPANGDCDFEYGWCGYSQAVDDDFNWLRRSKSTSRRPIYDHTIGAGELKIYIVYWDKFQSSCRHSDNEKEKFMKRRHCQLRRERGTWHPISFFSKQSRNPKPSQPAVLH